jgi:hypothetical protein
MVYLANICNLVIFYFLLQNNWTLTVYVICTAQLFFRYDHSSIQISKGRAESAFPCMIVLNMAKKQE